jgi:hypothetical protein
MKHQPNRDRSASDIVIWPVWILYAQAVGILSVWLVERKPLWS